MKLVLVKFNSDVNGSQYIIAPVCSLDVNVVCGELDAMFDPSDTSYKFLPKGDAKSIKYPESILDDWDVKTSNEMIDNLLNFGEFYIDNVELESVLAECYKESTYKEYTID